MSFQSAAISDDSLRAVVDTVFSAAAYQWTDTEPRLGWLARWWGVLVDWMTRFRESNPTAADVMFWSLVAILVLIFLHGGWIMFHAVRDASAGDERPSPRAAMLVRDERWFLKLAEALAAEGRYSEAMQAAFSALALRLDARGIVRFDPSKTPREYIREARLDESARSRLGESVRRLYAHAYAGAPASPGEYHAWRESLEQHWNATQA